MSAWLAVIAEGVPPVVRALPAVLWRGEAHGPGKPTKVPYRVSDPRRCASTTDPSTWGRFDDAVAVAATPELRIDGVGVVLTLTAGITCLDLDGVLGPDGRLDPRAATVVERCDSFTEVSPSGTGLHVFVLGRVPRALKGEQIEVYSDARYIAVTGHRWPGTPRGLTDQQTYLDHLMTTACADERPRRPWTGPVTAAPDDLAGALLAKLSAWGIDAPRVKPWSGGYLVELAACPWAHEHTSGPGGAAVMIHPSGAYDFICQHAHCGGRRWRDFRAAVERPS